MSSNGTAALRQSIRKWRRLFWETNFINKTTEVVLHYNYNSNGPKSRVVRGFIKVRETRN